MIPTAMAMQIAPMSFRTFAVIPNLRSSTIATAVVVRKISKGCISVETRHNTASQWNQRRSAVCRYRASSDIETI
jgi:hypothetical protein